MLFKLLSLPVSLPVAGLKFCFQQVIDFAEAELMDDTPVREELMMLNLQLEEGQITEDEFLEREAVLMQRLREIRAYRDQKLQEQLAAQGAAEEQPEEGAPTRRRVVVESPFGDSDSS